MYVCTFFRFEDTQTLFYFIHPVSEISSTDLRGISLAVKNDHTVILYGITNGVARADSYSLETRKLLHKSFLPCGDRMVQVTLGGKLAMAVSY